MNSLTLLLAQCRRLQVDRKTAIFLQHKFFVLNTNQLELDLALKYFLCEKFPDFSIFCLNFGIKMNTTGEKPQLSKTTTFGVCAPFIIYWCFPITSDHIQSNNI